MKRQDIIKEISRATGVKPKIAADVIERFISVVKESLSHGDDVQLRGFGTFCRVSRKARKARIINAGQEIVVPAHDTVKFKPAKELKDSMT